MKVAIMQPYFFPYLGYFQLIHSVDKFIILDDVNFIKRGWVNRNRILVNGNEFVFTVPIKNASQNRKINESELTNDNRWREKLLKTIELAYKKAPRFDEVFPVISQCINLDEEDLARFVAYSIQTVVGFLALDTTVVSSSSQYETGDLHGADRLIEICRQEEADTYVNAIGGQHLYNSDEFARHGIQLNFIQPHLISYPQFTNTFIPGLSIIDWLMQVDRQNQDEWLTAYELIIEQNMVAVS